MYKQQVNVQSHYIQMYAGSIQTQKITTMYSIWRVAQSIWDLAIVQFVDVAILQIHHVHHVHTCTCNCYFHVKTFNADICNTLQMFKI